MASIVRRLRRVGSTRGSRVGARKPRTDLGLGVDRRQVALWVLCWAPCLMLFVITALDPHWAVVNTLLGYAPRGQ